jgi:hypothetical protein
MSQVKGSLAGEWQNAKYQGAIAANHHENRDPATRPWGVRMSIRNSL